MKSAIALSLAVAPVAFASSGTVSFQNGIDGYAGTTDLRVSSTANRQALGRNETYFFVDGFRADDPATTANEASPDEQGLIRFDQIFGSALGQVPTGAYITSARLTLVTPIAPAATGQPANGGVANSNSPAPWGVGKLNQGFTAGATVAASTKYTDFGTKGPNVASGTAGRTVDTFFNRTTKNIAYGETLSADVAPIVRQWATGETNHGFTVNGGDPASTTDGWAFRTTGHSVATERPKLTVSYTTDPVTTIKFQQGTNGYASGSSTYIRQNQDYDAFSPDGNAVTQAYVDGFRLDDANTTANEASPDDQMLVRFGDLFGNATGQVPDGATILRATLKLTTAAGGNSRTEDAFDVRRMLNDWDGNADDSTLPTYYSEFGTGLGLTEAAGVVSAPVGTASAIINDGEAHIDVTTALLAWQAGAANYGFDLQYAAGTVDGWQLFFNGALDPSLRPELSVTYSTAVPEPTALGLLALGGLGLLRRKR